MKKSANPADTVEHWDIERLIPYARNSRTHSEAQIAQIAASMKEWGVTSAVLVDEDGGIIAGHGRVLAARKLGKTEMAVMIARGWTDAQKKAYVIADNQLALNAGWDTELLSCELADLQDLEFDLSLLGVAAEELQALLIDAEEVSLPILKDGEKEPFQQMAFLLHDDQVEVVKDAIDCAKDMGAFDDGCNTNSNANALERICEFFVRQNVKS